MCYTHVLIKKLFQINYPSLTYRKAYHKLGLEKFVACRGFEFWAFKSLFYPVVNNGVKWDVEVKHFVPHSIFNVVL